MMTYKKVKNLKYFPNNQSMIVLIIVLSSLFIHAYLISFPLVNFEYAFIGVADYFRTSNNLYLEQFFRAQANTLGMPYLTYLASTALPEVELITLYRLINLIGIPLLVFSIIKICRFSGIENHIPITLLIIFNPIIWNFSERATADFFPAALAIFAVSVTLTSKKIFPSFLAGLILGIATVLKYHAILLLLFIAFFYFWKETPKLAAYKLTIVSMVAISITFVYLYLVYINFDFLVVPVHFQNVHKISFSNFLSNFLQYSGFLVLIAIPTFFLSRDFLKVAFSRLKVTGLVFAVSIIMYYFMIDSGELNLGPLDSYVSIDMRMFILVFGGAIFFIIFFISQRGADDPNFIKVFWYTIITILLILSSTRPAQRYLIFILPFMIMVLPTVFLKSRLIVVSTICFFFIINIYIEYNRWNTGVAAILMAQEIEANGFMQDTDPGAIYPHVGNRFPVNDAEKKDYVIVAQKNNDAIIITSSGIGGLKKYYSLIRK